MYKDKYVFAQLVSFLDRNCFNYLVRKYGADKYVKFFSCWNQLLTLIFTLVRDKGLLRIVPIVLEGASGALSISVSTRALATTPSKRTLKKWNCVGGVELPYEVGEEVLQSIAVLVDLQETLFMLGGGRYCLQSAFLICP